MLNVNSPWKTHQIGKLTGHSSIAFLLFATRLVKIIGVALTAYGGSGKKKVNSSKQGRDHLSHKEGTTNIHNMHKGDQSLPNTSAVTTNTSDDQILRSAGTEKHSSSVNNGTEDAFINSGGGHQYFKEAEFNTGVQVAKGRHAPCSGNNGTKSSFRNSGSGKQDFGNAKFNTGANYN
ncbi:hypothetical protein JHK86_012821 [Glycine max]|nr:hypothetical protein JHK86_012821 [Glycine max]